MHPIPRWIAPLLGAVIGGLLSLFAGVRHVDPRAIALGILLGALAGGLVYLLDSSSIDPDGSSPSGGPPLISRAFAVLSIPALLIPIGSIVFALISLLLNKRAMGWPRIVSRVVMVLSVALTVLFGFAIKQGW